MVPYPAALDLPHALVEWVTMLVAPRARVASILYGEAVRGMSLRDQPPEATMTFSNVQVLSPEGMTTPCSVSVMLSTGVF